MKKHRTRRFVLSTVQHFAAFFIAIVIALILFHSYMTVETLEGKQTYYLNLLSTEAEFEDTDEFADIFHNSVSDIIRYVVVKDQMETDGVFSNEKKIDITRFGVEKQDEIQSKAIFYKLGDLIKWGIYGVEYTERAMSLHDFVEYFGYVLWPENFGLTTDGQLYFKGFYRLSKIANEDEKAEALIQIGEICETGIMEKNQLEELVFSYVMANSGDEVKLSREEDGAYTVTVKMLNNRYTGANGKTLLYENATNWLDYFQFQNKLQEAITTLSGNYELYQKCNYIYDDDNSNLKYTVRMITDGESKTFSNEVGMDTLEDVDITDYFLEFHRYLIYYPENLSYMGINPMSESEIYNLIREYDYAYPESTHIWIAVDTSYSKAGDAFYHANRVFQDVVPKLKWYFTAIVFMVLLWVCIAGYLTYTAGLKEDAIASVSNTKYEITFFDKIYTEFFFLFVIVYIYGIFWGKSLLVHVADEVFESHALFIENSSVKFNGYLYFGCYGMLLSLLGSMLWYSLIRRVRCERLWKDSMVCHMYLLFAKAFHYVITHKNSVVSTLLPYFIFLMTNVLCLICTFLLPEYRILFLLLMLGLDIIVGFFLFRQNSEQVDIVDGIRRIRDGDVEHKLNTKGLHGQNLETALAINTIGEGISNAVKTSVKDEQLKTDLITNVSHDLKTPLTSIVSYIDLLKRLDIDNETAKSYIEILDGKANRLKVLTDDLVEVSKITSGNIVLTMEILNLTELIKQALGEFSDLLEEKKLEPVFRSEENCLIYADSRRMWRVIENLFNNVCKYGLAQTRVFMTLKRQQDKIEFSIKNISNHKLDLTSEDLTERFFRGDVSRTTEGSGLGLSIAKSLVQVQGGTFQLEVDGDSFMVLISFHEYIQERGEGDT